ncbi:MAG: redoxin domain-containing protein [Nitrospinae bacterium]|nr:redoxin domain-containing protein [Nitrospinota bacterium]
MFSGKRIFFSSLLMLVLMLAACGNNLLPSGEDKRAAATGGAGNATSQTAPAFTMGDTNGGAVSLAALNAAGKHVVLYFTMWCPICDAHMQHMQSKAMVQYPNVAYIAVDYLSGSVAGAAAAQSSAGYGSSPFIVAADVGQTVMNAYHATMGTTVVIDKTGVIRMNEDYKDGASLLAALGAL